MPVVYQFVVFVSCGTMMNYSKEKRGTVTRSAGTIEKQFFVNELERNGFRYIQYEGIGAFPNIYVLLGESTTPEISENVEVKFKQLQQSFPKCNFPNIIVKTINQ